MYIAIFEDGTFSSVERISDADLQSVDAGVLDLIDISVVGRPRFYIDGEWIELNTVRSGE